MVYFELQWFLWQNLNKSVLFVVILDVVLNSSSDVIIQVENSEEKNETPRYIHICFPQSEWIDVWNVEMMTNGSRFNKSDGWWAMKLISIAHADKWIVTKSLLPNNRVSDDGNFAEWLLIFLNLSHQWFVTYLNLQLFYWFHSHSSCFVLKMRRKEFSWAVNNRKIGMK